MQRRCLRRWQSNSVLIPSSHLLCLGNPFAQILRVFYDRLVDGKDGAWFLGFLKQTLTVREGHASHPMHVPVNTECACVISFVS
jgi:hypothetical protein